MFSVPLITISYSPVFIYHMKWTGDEIELVPAPCEWSSGNSFQEADYNDNGMGNG